MRQAMHRTDAAVRIGAAAHCDEGQHVFLRSWTRCRACHAWKQNADPVGVLLDDLNTSYLEVEHDKEESVFVALSTLILIAES